VRVLVISHNGRDRLVVPGVGLVRQAEAAVAHPAGEAAQEAAPLADLVEGGHHAGIHQAEVRGLGRDVDAGQGPEDPVVQVGGQALEGAGIAVGAAHGVDDLVAVAPGAHERLDQLRRMLEVRVHAHQGVARAEVHPRRQRHLVPEVPGEGEQLDARILLVQRGHGLRRAVGAAVVHEDQLEVTTKFRHHGHDALVQRNDVVLFVEGRDHQRQLGLRRWLHGSLALYPTPFRL